MVAGHLSIKNGKYYIVLNYINEVGDRKTKWIGTGLTDKGNKRRAESMLLETRTNFKVENEIKKSDILYSDFLLNWLEIIRNNIEITTYANYALSINKRIVPYFKKQKILLVDLTPKQIQDFYTYSMNTCELSSNTIIHFHANIRKSLQYALKLDMIPFNPADRIERPKSKPFISGYYNITEINELFNLVKGTKLEIAVTMAAFYGLRRSEILGLKWEAIDFVNKTITIKNIITKICLNGKCQTVEANRTKNKSSYRSLPLVPKYEELLQRMKSKQQHLRKICGRSYQEEYLDYVCVDEMGNLIKPDYFSSNFSILIKKNHMKKIRFHDLRHSCASLLLANGISMKEIQEWLGHSNYSTTANIYAHLDQRSKLNAANVMINAFDNCN